MIKVTRLRAPEPDLYLNAELIEAVESIPDTVITLTTGRKLVVQEAPEAVAELVIAYKRRIFGAIFGTGG